MNVQFFYILDLFTVLEIKMKIKVLVDILNLLNFFYNLATHCVNSSHKMANDRIKICGICRQTLYSKSSLHYACTLNKYT